MGDDAERTPPPARRSLTLGLAAMRPMLPDRTRQFVRLQTFFVSGKLFNQTRRDLVGGRSSLASALVALSTGNGLIAGAVLRIGTAESVGIALRAGTPQPSRAAPAPSAAPASHPGMMFPQRLQRLRQFIMRKFAIHIGIEFLAGGRWQL